MAGMIEEKLENRVRCIHESGKTRVLRKDGTNDRIISAEKEKWMARDREMAGKEDEWNENRETCARETFFQSSPPYSMVEVNGIRDARYGIIVEIV